MENQSDFSAIDVTTLVDIVSIENVLDGGNHGNLSTWPSDHELLLCLYLAYQAGERERERDDTKQKKKKKKKKKKARNIVDREHVVCKLHEFSECD